MYINIVDIKPEIYSRKLNPIDEFTSRKMRRRLNVLGAGTLFIEPGSPWKNHYIARRDRPPATDSIPTSLPAAPLSAASTPI